MSSGIRFELKKSTDDQWYFTIVARNGRVLVTSEMYKRDTGAINAIEVIQAGARDARIREDGHER